MTIPHLVPEQVTSLAPFALAGVFGLAEVHLATTLAQAHPGASEDVLLGAALAARAPLHGSVCIELATIRDTVVSSLVEPTDVVAVESAPDVELSDTESVDDDTEFVAPVDADPRSPQLEDLAWPDVAHWQAELLASPLVEVVDPRRGSAPLRSPTDPLQPLVLEGGRLYLARYWRLEQLVGSDLKRRTAAPSTAAPSTATPSTAATDSFGPAAVARERIGELFAMAASADRTEVDDGQLVAATAITERDLVVISGGPGTGKTTTVAHLLAGLVSSQHAGGDPPTVPARERIALVAPTGKAAARMTEAIRDAVERLASHLPDEVVDELNALEAVTIHRLLGTRGAGFWHGPDRPLTHDLVIVDEVSMVSLSLMAHLLSAIPTRSKVVLVGDPHQLASVEAGTVLGDVVGVGGPVGGSGEPSPPAGIAPSVRALRTVHRQKAGSAILDLANAIRLGRADDVVTLLRSADPGEVRWIDAEALDGSVRADPGPAEPVRAGSDDHTRQPTLFEAGLGRAATDTDHHREHRGRYQALRAEVEEMALAAVRAAQQGDGPEALRAISSLKLLCALRRGPMGVDRWNRSVEDHLRERRAIRRGDWYAGRPTMVTENDYLNRVFNGDVGVALPSEVTTGDGGDAASHRVLFRRPGTNQEVEAVRLDRVATQWAMSIHKSQGSEFPHAVVVLPPPPARILTRELLYTGVTRAKERLTVVAGEASIRAAVDRPVARASGLAARLA